MKTKNQIREIQKRIILKRWRRKQRRHNKCCTTNNTTTRTSSKKRIDLRMPKKLCLESNYKKTMAAIYAIRNAYETNGNGNQILLHLEDIKTMGVTESLLLAAEIYRWKYSKSVNLRPTKVKHWSNEVKALFKGFRLFDLLDIAADEIRLESSPERKYFNYKTDKTGDCRILMEFYNYLVKEIGYFSKEICQGIFEAILNVINHSCTDGECCDLMQKRWWLAAVYEPEDRILKMMVYDHGVGMTTTLPTDEYFIPILKLVLDNNKGKWIQKAITEGKSRTLLDHRGKGLPCIHDYIKNRSEGLYLKIISGDGLLHYDKNTDKFTPSNNSSKFKGTLVEWAIKISSRAGEQ